MSLYTFARIAAAVAVTTGIARFAIADLKGDYNVEFVVQETPYTGTFKTTAASKGAFTAKIDFTSPANVVSEGTGTTAGDSMTFNAKYEDKTRGCSGTFAGRGKVEKDGSKGDGVVEISDSCSGALSGKFRIWR